MRSYHRDRLLRLADKLDGSGPYEEVGPIPYRKFYMNSWFAGEQGGYEINQEDFNPHKCNTAACAVGWAYSDSWFRKRKLRSPLECDIHGGHEQFWGMTDETFDRIFGSRQRLVKPQTIAKEIRKYVESSV